MYMYVIYVNDMIDICMHTYDISQESYVYPYIGIFMYVCIICRKNGGNDPNAYHMQYIWYLHMKPGIDFVHNTNMYI